MSNEYCEDCDRMIDLDWDIEHEHFQKSMKGGQENNGNN